MNNQFYRRRNFLKALMIGGFALTATGTYLWRTNQETDIIVAILKNKLGKLKISNEDFLTFAQEYVSEKYQYKKQFTSLSLFSNIFTIMTPYSFLPMNHPLKRMEDNIVSNFLLSTDFFQNGADIHKDVNYLGFYDPYKRPCANFFV